MIYCLIAGSSVGTCKSDPRDGYPTEPYAFTSMTPGKVATMFTAKGTLTGTFQVRYEEKIKDKDLELSISTGACLKGP